MKKGVVVDYNDDFVTLLTPDGQFLKTNNKKGNYELGEEISFFPSIDEREEAATRVSRVKERSFFDLFNSHKAKVGALSVIAIMFLMIGFLPFFNDDKVYAYMSIDINPSFEIGIDSGLNVISLEPLNDEAEKLITKLPKWDNKQFQLVVDEIIAESKSEGYVYPGKEIVITTVINKEDKDVQTKLKENIDAISLSYENEKMVVKTIETDGDTREKAQKQGISTGKYIKLKEKADALKEKMIEPSKEIDEPEKSPTTDQTNNNSLPDHSIENRQSVKNELSSDRNEKNNGANNKLNESSKKLENHIKKQEANNLKHRKNTDKNEGKNSSNKEKRYHKDDRNDRKDRDNWEDRNSRKDRNNWEDRNGRKDRDNWEERNDRKDRDNWEERNDRKDRDNWDERNDRKDRDNWEERNDRKDRDSWEERNDHEDKDDWEDRNDKDEEKKNKWNNRDRDDDD